MFNWDTRYANLLKEWGEDLEKGSVLEVGCGPLGVAQYLRNKVTGIELHKIEPAVENLQIVEGSITAIPYSDNAFDYVICSDVLEHLPASSRSTAIAEIIRVAKKKCFIQGPHGNVAFRAEEELAETLARAKKKLPQWLKEHLKNGLPMAGDTVKGIVDAGYIPSIKKNEGIIEHYASVMLDLFSPKLKKFQANVKRKSPLSEIRSVESDEPYSLLITVDKQRPLQTAEDPFVSEIATLAKGRVLAEGEVGKTNISFFSVHHKSSELLGRFKLIKAFDVSGRLPGIETGLKEPKGFFEENNDRCSEMSAFHYVWDRRLYGDIVGFCHYRRYLYPFPEEIKEPEITVNAEEAAALLPRIEDEAQIRALLGQYDLLTARPMDFSKSQDEQYARRHFADDYFTMVGCIIEKYPFLSEALNDSMNSKNLYAANMLVCKGEFFDVFCRVWFEILECCAMKLDPSGRNAYQTRDIAFLSERVFDTLIRHLKRHGYRVGELPKVFVDPDVPAKANVAQEKFNWWGLRKAFKQFRSR